MAKFLYLYNSGGAAAPQTPEEGAAVMDAWNSWFGQLGDALVDGGNPTAASQTVASDGAISGGSATGIGGYSVVQADSLDAASALAKGCPVLSDGGSVEVHELLDM